MKIDFSQIPSADLRALWQSLIECCEKFYENPENVRKYEQWKKAKEEKAKQLSPKDR